MRGGKPSELNLGLRFGESMNFTIRGDCMSAFDDGESIEVRRQRLYLPGDVIIVRRRGHWNAHRFLGYTLSTHGIVALTQADDSNARDPAARRREVVGRARCEVGGRARLAALGSYGRALIERISGARQ